MTFYFHKEAETEFLEAIEYYESCTPGLGEDFSLEVNSTIQNILFACLSLPIIS
jgi:hypothetical protein